MSETAFISEKHCPVCGKQFTVLWPSQWAYKRGREGLRTYLCSWKCLRVFDKEEELKTMGGAKRIVSDEDRQQAVEIAIAGGDPRRFLEGLGVKAPDNMWYEIKKRLKENSPETYAKLPEKLPDRKRVPMIETPEEPKITKPVGYDGFTVRAVDGDFGSYHFQEINGKQWIDYDDKEYANQLSMTVEQWRGFLAEIRKAALVLGVEL